MSRDHKIFRFDIRPPDSRYPSSQERRDFGSYGFLANSKTILPYSFTILMSSAPEAVFLKYGQASEDLINTMEDLLNNYFTTNHIQRAVIYDVRIQNDKILFDCTLGKYFMIIIDPNHNSNLNSNPKSNLNSETCLNTIYGIKFCHTIHH